MEKLKSKKVLGLGIVLIIILVGIFSLNNYEDQRELIQRAAVKTSHHDGIAKVSVATKYIENGIYEVDLTVQYEAGTDTLIGKDGRTTSPYSIFLEALYNQDIKYKTIQIDEYRIMNGQRTLQFEAGPQSQRELKRFLGH